MNTSLQQKLTTQWSQITIIAAQPGWYVIQPVSDGSGKVTALLKDCIIGWMIVANALTSADDIPRCTVTPLTVSGHAGDSEVLCDPTGRMEIPFLESFGCEHAVIEYFEKTRAGRAAATKNEGNDRG